MTLRLPSAGESPGPELVAIIPGPPAGLLLDRAAIGADLRRRQEGYGRSPRQQIEQARVEVLAGLRHGRTLGTPLALVVRNVDHKNWVWGMSPWPPEGEPEGKGTKAVTLPRPGHADLAGVLKYELGDVRNALERASARHTAAHVAAGAVAKALLAAIGARVESSVVEVGGSNGEPIVVRGAMKPLPTLMRPLRSVDLASGEPAQALVERSDTSAVEALAVVAEAAVAFELAAAAREKFGGDSIGDFVAA